MILLMKSLQEEKQVDRVMKDVHDEPFIDRVIVIDGGSVDFTVQALRQYEKVEVYVHPWLHWYHDMEITQSNIALSYIPYNHLAFILDFDEKMSDKLKFGLGKIDITYKAGRFNYDLGLVPRRTYELVRQGPFCMYDVDDGFPIIQNQIGQYPDYQCRLIKRTKGMHWINSPHHVMYPQDLETIIIEGADVLHFEKDDIRDRERIERLWLRAQAQRKKLGLEADLFETNVKPERAMFADPEHWKDT